VVVLDLLPHAPLESVAAAVERGVLAEGFQAEGRTFRAHMTLGRVKRGGRAPRLDSAAAPDAAPFAVNQVVLFRSELAPTGARYTALERMALGASLHPSSQSLED
jgi:2'-5' RNA ligase